MTKEVAVINKKSLLKELSTELNNDIITARRNQIKQQMKEIKMTEILLQKQKENLNKLLDTKTFDEKDVLFSDD